MRTRLSYPDSTAASPARSGSEAGRLTRACAWLLLLAAACAGEAPLFSRVGAPDAAAPPNVEGGVDAPPERPDTAPGPDLAPPPPPLDAGPAPGLLAHWRLDETDVAGGTLAQDGSGNGLHLRHAAGGTRILGAERLTFSNPGALRLDGADGQHLALPTVPEALKQPATTVSVWFRSVGAPVTAAPLVSVGMVYWLRIEGSGPRVALRVSRIGGSPEVILTGSLPALADGRWHHVAGVVDPGNRRMAIYVDGSLEIFYATSMPLTYSPRPVEGLHLGRDFDADRLWNLTGALDDVRIYGRGLSTAEIAALAAGGP